MSIRVSLKLFSIRSSKAKSFAKNISSYLLYLVDELFGDKNDITVIGSISYQTADSAAGKRGGATSVFSYYLPSSFFATTAYVQAEFNIDRRTSFAQCKRRVCIAH